MPHRPEVQIKGTLKSPKCDSTSTLPSYEVCYQMEMLRNAAEIVGRFCAKLNAFRLYKKSLPW